MSVISESAELTKLTSPISFSLSPHPNHSSCDENKLVYITFTLVYKIIYKHPVKMTLLSDIKSLKVLVIFS